MQQQRQDGSNGGGSTAVATTPTMTASILGDEHRHLAKNGPAKAPSSSSSSSPAITGDASCPSPRSSQLLAQIQQLEPSARKLEPSDDEMKCMTDQVTAYGQQFIRSIPEAPAWGGIGEDESTIASEVLDYPPEDDPIPLQDILGVIDRNVVQKGINEASPRQFGYVPGGGIYASSLADYIAAVTNRFSGIFFASPAAVRLENMCVRWTANFVGFCPNATVGFLSSGGSIATLSAMICARDAYNVLENQKKFCMYMTDELHNCVRKAMGLSGTGLVNVRVVKKDAKLRMSVESLEEMVQEDISKGLTPWVVAGSAGTVNCGAVDPLDKIATIAAKYNIWFHVDGAYGGMFALCPLGRKRLAGMERADSLVVDPHKSLFLPFGTGMLLVKKKALLLRSHAVNTAYLQRFVDDMEEVSPADISPELTRHFRALRMWLPLKLFGVTPFRDAQTEKILLARYFHDTLPKKDPRFAVFAHPSDNSDPILLPNHHHQHNSNGKAADSTQGKIENDDNDDDMYGPDLSIVMYRVRKMPPVGSCARAALMTASSAAAAVEASASSSSSDDLSTTASLLADERRGGREDDVRESSQDVRNRRTDRVREEALKDGTVYISGTNVHGECWLRLCVLVFRTHKEHVDMVMKHLSEALDRVLELEEEEASPPSPSGCG